MESWLGPSCHQPTFSRHCSPRTGGCHPYVAISSNTSRACARSVARQRAGHSRQLHLLYAAAALFTQSPKSPSVTTSRTKNFSRRSASNGQPPAARSPTEKKELPESSMPARCDHRSASPDQKAGCAAE
ncbi:Os05g0161600 [Oryza sativa Japonica Group]|uniref:Os05g0161600 protein n=1 Tax=Oryza sativa subsp. japonica TaxID=39947 RepID=A0A0P0WI98_ORYSJ|nr:Os05g0161600 [Oryza sativa Japonica Group]